MNRLPSYILEVDIPTTLSAPYVSLDVSVFNLEFDPSFPQVYGVLYNDTDSFELSASRENTYFSLSSNEVPSGNYVLEIVAVSKEDYGIYSEEVEVS